MIYCCKVCVRAIIYRKIRLRDTQGNCVIHTETCLRDLQKDFLPDLQEDVSTWSTFRPVSVIRRKTCLRDLQKNKSMWSTGRPVNVIYMKTCLRDLQDLPTWSTGIAFQEDVSVWSTRRSACVIYRKTCLRDLNEDLSPWSTRRSACKIYRKTSLRAIQEDQSACYPGRCVCVISPREAGQRDVPARASWVSAPPDRPPPGTTLLWQGAAFHTCPLWPLECHPSHLLLVDRPLLQKINK